MGNSGESFFFVLGGFKLGTRDCGTVASVQVWRSIS